MSALRAKSLTDNPASARACLMRSRNSICPVYHVWPYSAIAEIDDHKLEHYNATNSGKPCQRKCVACAAGLQDQRFLGLGSPAPYRERYFNRCVVAGDWDRSRD